VIRTQIQLTEEQDQRLRQLAAKRRCSLAEVIRQALDQYVEQIRGREDDVGRKHRALAAIGKYSGGQADVSREHDEYLAEAFRK
jgi:predicted transcriptional regulator